MKRIRHFLYLLFHRRARRIYREMKNYPGTPKDIVDPIFKPLPIPPWIVENGEMKTNPKSWEDPKKPTGD